ncbi:lantibiotic protection ABC transporter ATP-binding subunit [Paenibacillus tyrfis]|uniref:lantibiotic protection ABC transporter ATP-binding subunit n=1 Tax=Paenibacillus tyrfis TaxID=1501230 RepID=UPI00209C9FEC|nr:lantibiotic protection ABC transporter ATP-binding subunit [Paenibacillus tyrfis]MCP1308117.1 lantibiotic protection ABC transporter ATP-binding subunit [Paenibacillus tyrfis]
MRYIVKTEGLTKRFGRQHAVRDVSLEISEGCVYGLLGPNGAGKTTVLKMLVGLLRPTLGKIELFGEPWQRKQLARVGTLIETPGLYNHLTGRENLQVHQRLLRLPEQRIDEVLRIVGLSEVSPRKKTAAYSLGMKQRLGIAIALLNQPKLLILDEPTNGLDPMGIREMRSLIHSFTEQGITVILSSHILSEVEQIVQEVGIINRGQLQYQGTLQDLKKQGNEKDDLESLFMRYIEESGEGRVG